MSDPTVTPTPTETGACAFCPDGHPPYLRDAGLLADPDALAKAEMLREAADYCDGLGISAERWLRDHADRLEREVWALARAAVSAPEHAPGEVVPAAEYVRLARAALAARPAPTVNAGDGSWWGPEDCHERECEDFGDPEPGEHRLNPETDWPCSHVVWVPARIEEWIREDERKGRPAPTVNAADVERALEALLRFPATFEGTQWVSAAVLRGLIDSTEWATVLPGTVDGVAAIIRRHYDHPDGEGSVECVCGGYEGPGDIFDHQAERVIAALGLTVADEGRA